MPLIVTGSIGIDTIETPTGSAREVLGGSSIYFAAAASFFGPVRLVGAVGQDFPDNFIDEFHYFHVDVAGLEKRAGSKTFRWHGRYLDNMNDRETLSVDLNVLIEDLPPVPASFADSEYVFLATTSPSNQLQLLDAFPNRKLVVADTIDLYINIDRDALIEVIKRIDGIIINDSEAKLLTGKSSVTAAADKILEWGPTFAVIKKGEHGALLRHKHGTAVLPAFPDASVVDPTGAGDSFAGGMLGYIAHAQDSSFESLKTAMGYGTMVASFTIESFSVGRLKSISRADIDQRMAQFRKMVSLG